MAISHELSGDIAAALLTNGEKTPEQREKLKRVLVEVHQTLSQMSDNNRKAKAKAATASGTNGPKPG